MLQDFDGKAVPALLRDFRAMRASFLKSGLFKSNKAYYVWKLLSTFSLLGVAVAFLLAARESMLALVSPPRPAPAYIGSVHTELFNHTSKVSTYRSHIGWCTQIYVCHQADKS